MQKRITIITIIIIAIIFLGGVIGTYLLVNSSFTKKTNDLNTQLDAAQAELDALKTQKDANGFTPTEVVKAFFNEVKSDSVDKAKLYLAPEVQDMDIKATLKLGSDIVNISTGDNFEQADGNNVIVNMTFILATDDTTVRTFTLSKYDDVWKITGVTAE